MNKISFKMLFFLLLFLFSLDLLAIQANAESLSPFISKYLDDPYCIINKDRLGYEGEVFLNNAFSNLAWIHIILQETEFRDMDNDRKDDLILSYYQLYQNRLYKYNLILYNHFQDYSFTGNFKLCKFFGSYWILPSSAEDISPPSTTSIASRDSMWLKGDLNGDGYKDLIFLQKSTKGNGYVANISKVLFNTGIRNEFVDEMDFRKFIFDLRIGYLASYTKTFLNGIDNVTPQNIVDAFTKSSEDTTRMKYFSDNAVIPSKYLDVTINPEDVYNLNGDDFIYGSIFDKSTQNPELIPMINAPYDDLKGSSSSSEAESKFNELMNSPVYKSLYEPNFEVSKEVGDFLNEHQEINFYILNEIKYENVQTHSNPSLYVPNYKWYTIGIRIGAQKATNDLDLFKKAQISFYTITKVRGDLDQISRLNTTSDINTVKNVSGKFVENFNEIEKLNLNGSANIQNWSYIINLPIFLPRRVKIQNDALVFVDGNSYFKLNRNYTIPIPELSTLVDRSHMNDESFHKLHGNWFVDLQNNKNEYLLNGGYISGLCLAYLTLNGVRSSQNYFDEIKDLNKAKEYSIKIRESLVRLPKPLWPLRDNPALQTGTGIDFYLASISSGYSNIPDMFLQECGAFQYYQGYNEGYLQGYLKGQSDALKQIKNMLCNEIPSLSAATSITQAAIIISNDIDQKEREIAELKGIISDLRNTITNLNNTITSANKLINELSKTNEDLQLALEDARKTMTKVGDAADDIGGLARAATGFLIGGPMGAIIGLIFG